jgi:regulation of enolase protein 1 (concanavalin A-like superfamily)
MVTGAAARASAQPIDRIFTIVMENHEYEDIIGNPSAPYLNRLAAENGLATNYTAIQHPSLPDYMALTGGEPVFDVDCDTCRVDATSIVDVIEGSGRTWTAYMEGMSTTCGLANEGRYAVRHNPFVYYRAVSDNAARCASHVVPFTRFAADLSSASLSNYVWITPDLCHDMHDCDVASGDAWLQSVVPSIVASPAFANAVLFITWDEGTTAIGGGGRVPLIVVSPRTPAGMRSDIPATHYSVLRTIENLWGLRPLGESASARSLTEFFNLLQAPGFESYLPPSLGLPGWVSDPIRQTPAFSETHQPRSGARNAACWTPSTLDCGLYQVVTAPATGLYALTMYANADRPGGLVGANVNGTLAATAAVAVHAFGNYGAPYAFTFAASAGDQIIVWMYSPAAPGYVVLDDVSLVLARDDGGGLPPGWSAVDVGNVGVAGSAVYASGVWTVAGAGGAAVWGTSDAFRFVFQSLNGDGHITARVDSLQFTTPFAKAGVMIRAGVGSSAANVILSIRPTGSLEFMQRRETGGETTFQATATTVPPYWVRLSRSGTTITGSISGDGITWVTVGSLPWNGGSVVDAGLVVTSNDSNRLNTATFDGVSLLPGP